MLALSPNSSLTVGFSFTHWPQTKTPRFDILVGFLKRNCYVSNSFLRRTYRRCEIAALTRNFLSIVPKFRLAKIAKDEVLKPKRSYGPTHCKRCFSLTLSSILNPLQSDFQIVQPIPPDVPFMLQSSHDDTWRYALLIGKNANVQTRKFTFIYESSPVRPRNKEV